MDLIDAIIFNDSNRVQSLLEKEINPNMEVEDGLTPLHFAVVWNAEQVIALLLAAGADPYRVSDEGQSPLQLAYQFKNERIIRLFNNLKSSIRE